MTKVYQVLIDSVATADGAPIVGLKNAKRVTIFVKRADHSSGSSVLTASLSPNGADYVATNKLIDNVTNTNAQTLTRVASKTLSSNTTVFLSLDPDDTAEFLKINVTRVTDGTNNCWVVVDYDVATST